MSAFDLHFRATLCALVIVGVTACSSKQAQTPELVPEEELAGAPLSEYENPAAIPHPSPPQPNGPPVGRRDILMNAAAPALGEWLELWQAALPGFRTDSLWRVSRERWAPRSVRRWEGVEQLRELAQDMAFELLGIASPDSHYTLDVDSYQYISHVGDSLEVGGEPDSQPTLIDHYSGVESVLQQCGTSCGFHWGTWLSPTRFVLGGWADADDHGQWLQGRLWIYSLSDSTVSGYSTRIVPAGEYARYERAWKRWLLTRYQALAARRRS